MAEHRWSKFWWQDWTLDPALRACSLAAKGLWMDMLAAMHAMPEVGILRMNGKALDDRSIARLVGASDPRQVSRLIAELEANAVFSREQDGSIFSRRCRRDAANSQQSAENGRKGGNPKLLKNNASSDKGVNPPLKLQEAEAEAEAQADRKSTPTPSGLGTHDGVAEGLPLDLPQTRKADTAKPHRPIPKHFDAWWSKYPRKEAKGAAQKAYLRAVQAGVDERELYRGLLHFAWGDDPAFHPHPATWLNQRRWEDEPVERKLPNGGFSVVRGGL